MALSQTALDLSNWHAGKTEYLDALLQRNMEWILGKVRQRLGPGLRRMVESSDIVQEAAIQFLKYAPRFTISEERHFRGLLARIVENVLRDQNDWFTAKRRAVAKQKPLPPDTILDLDHGGRSDKTPSQLVQRREDEAWIRLGMEFLDPEDREVLVLRQWDSLSFAEIGRRHGLTENAAWMRHNRAVGRLARAVGRLRRGKLYSVLDSTTSGMDDTPA